MHQNWPPTSPRCTQAQLKGNATWPSTNSTVLSAFRAYVFWTCSVVNDLSCWEDHRISCEIRFGWSIISCESIRLFSARHFGLGSIYFLIPWSKCDISLHGTHRQANGWWRKKTISIFIFYDQICSIVLIWMVTHHGFIHRHQSSQESPCAT